MLKSIDHFLTSILTHASAATTLAGPIASSDPSGTALISLWASTLGLIGLTTFQKHREDEETESLHDFLFRQMPTNQEVRRLFLEMENSNQSRDNQRSAALNLSSDLVARIENIDLTDIPIGDLRRPYVVFYRFLKERFDSQQEKSNEIMKALDANRILWSENANWQLETLALLVREFSHVHEEIGISTLLYRQLLQENHRILDAISHQNEDVQQRHSELTRELIGIRRELNRMNSPKLSLFLLAPSSDPSANQFYFGTQRVPVFGRTSEMHALREFILKPPVEVGSVDFWWWLWTGPAGSGKSRIALELCLEAEGLGFCAGFLDSDISSISWSDWKVDRPTLVVIDYASSDSENVRKAIVDLRKHPGNIRAPLRILLLARTAESGSDHWWELFRGGSTDREALRLCAYRADSWVENLSPLDDDALWSTIEYVLDERNAADKLRTQRDEILTAIMHIDTLKRPLFAAIAADAIAEHDGDVTSIRMWDQTSLSRHILQRELFRWNKAGVDEEHLNVLVFATVCGPQELEILDDLAKAGLVVPSKLQFQERLYNEMTGFSIRGDDRAIRPLEPDILGELFVLERLNGDLLAQSATNSVTASESTQRVNQAATFLNSMSSSIFLLRCAGDFPQHPSVVRLHATIEDASFPTLQRDISAEDGIHAAVRGEAYFAVERYDLAIQQFETALSSNSLHDEGRAIVYLFLGIANQNLGNSSNAIAFYTTVAESTTASGESKARALYNRSVIHRESRDFLVERNDLDTAAALEDVLPITRSKILNQRGVVRGRLGDKDGELSDFTEAISIDDEYGEQRAEAYYNRGVTYERESSLELAIADYSKAIAMENASTRTVLLALHNRALLLGRQGDIRSEIDDYTLMIERSDSVEMTARALYERAVAQRGIGNTESALEDYSRLIEMAYAPDDLKSQALYNRGTIFVERRENEKAVEDWSAIIELERPLESVIGMTLVKRGVHFYNMGETRKCIYDLSRAIHNVTLPENFRILAYQILESLKGK